MSAQMQMKVLAGVIRGCSFSVPSAHLWRSLLLFDRTFQAETLSEIRILLVGGIIALRLRGKAPSKVGQEQSKQRVEVSRLYVQQRSGRELFN